MKLNGTLNLRGDGTDVYIQVLVGDRDKNLHPVSMTRVIGDLPNLGIDGTRELSLNIDSEILEETYE